MNASETGLNFFFPGDLEFSPRLSFPDAHQRLPPKGPLDGFELFSATLPIFEIAGVTTQTGTKEPFTLRFPSANEPIWSAQADNESSSVARALIGGAFPPKAAPAPVPSSTRTTPFPGWLIFPANDDVVYAQTDPQEPQYDPTHLRTSSPPSLNHSPFHDCESAFVGQNELPFDLKALLDGDRAPCVQSDIFHLSSVQQLPLDQEGGNYLRPGTNPSHHPYKRARLSEDNLLHSQWTFGSESPAWSTDSSYNSPLSAASSSTKSNYERVESPFDNLQQPIKLPSNFPYPQPDLLAWPGQFDTTTLNTEQGHISDLASTIAPVVGAVRGTKRKHSLTPPTSPPASVSSTEVRYPRHRRAKKDRGLDTQMASCSWLIPDKNGALVQCGEAFTNRTLPTHMREQHQPWVRDDHGAMIPCPDNHELRCEWAGCQQLMKWGQLSRHIRTDLGWTVVHCPFCQKVLSRKDALDRHLRTNSCPAV